MQSTKDTMQPDTPKQLTAASVEPPIISVMAEQADIVRVTHPTGAVRVRIEHDQIDEALTLAHVTHNFTVQRVPRGHTVSAPQPPWAEGDVVVVPVYEEVAVIERRLVLREEIRLTPQAHHSTSEVNVPLRKERVVIERMAADGTWHEAADSAHGTQGT